MKESRLILFTFFTVALGFSAQASSVNGRTSHKLDNDKFTCDIKSETVKKSGDNTYKFTDNLFYSKNSISEFTGNYLIVTPSPPNYNSLDRVTQKSFLIKGVVKDESGEPIVGASVYVTSPSAVNTPLIATATDFDGKFSLRVSLNLNLVVSAVGFQPYNKKITTKKTDYNIVLKEEVNKIKDVVITGIVTRKKESFTGAAITVTGDELKAIGNSNILNTLKTLDPSLVIYEDNYFGSDPNRLPNIEIRGRTSISKLSLQDSFGKAPNQPLFILNGFPTSLQTVMDLDMNLVSSVTILKDAASTALYGSQAANGVVVIQTVRPKAGKLRINYNYDFQMQMPDLSDYNLMNAEEKLQFEEFANRWYSGIRRNKRPEQRYLLDKKKNSILADIRRGVNTYWLSEPLRTGFSTRHSIYLSGGSDSFTYGVGVNYKNADGVMKGSGRNTWGTNIDLNYRKGKINVSNNLRITGLNSNKSPYGSFYNFVIANPYYRKRDKNGRIRRYLDKENPLNLIPNPLYNASLPFIGRTEGLRIGNRLNMIFNITDKLRFTSGLFLSTSTDKAEYFLSREHPSFFRTTSDEKGSYTNRLTDDSEYNFNAMLTYSNFSEKHSITGSLRGEMSETKRESYQTKVVGFLSGSNGNPKFARGYPKNSKPFTNLNLYRKTKVLATVNYSYKNTYLFDATYTIDGSTNFGSDKKFYNFWSVGLGWNLHRQFNMDPKKVQMLKLRGNFGPLGNQNMGSTSSSGVYGAYQFTNRFGQGVHLTSLGNPYLEWQKTMQTSIGIDATLFDNRLNITANAYRKKTDPLIVNTKTDSSTGIPKYTVNLGFLDNKGLEFNLRYYPIYNKEERIYWSLGVTGRTEKNRYGGFYGKLDYLNDQESSNLTISSLTRYEDGNSPDDLWAVPSLGIDPATGDEVFLTKDNKETITFNYKDKRIVGNSRPKMEGVFSTSVQYKNFTVRANIRYRFGADVFNNALYEKIENINSNNIGYNQDKRALYNRWKKPGEISRFKRIDFLPKGTISSEISSRFIQRENVIIGESLNFSYELKDQRLMSKLGLSRLRFDLYTNDIFRLSSIKVERGTNYPFARSVSFSIKASF